MSDAPSALAYWVVRPGEGELRAERLRAEPRPGHSIVRAAFSAVSAGTERLVGLAQIPAACHAAMACRGMAGGFPLPVKYGYALVGIGVAGALDRRRVFVMHPHQDVIEIDDRDALLIPDAVPLPRATLFANLETAVNAVWDADLAPTERTLVIGAGAVGLLTALAATRLSGVAPTLAEADPNRAARAREFHFVARVQRPAEVELGSYDVAIHATGTAEGLQLAIDSLGFEGRVIDLSWYGATPVTLDLGSSFHHQRKRIVASQVATVAPSRRGPFGARERATVVWSLLADASLDRLFGEPIPFSTLPGFMNALYAGVVRTSSSAPCAPLVAYRA